MASAVGDARNRPDRRRDTAPPCFYHARVQHATAATAAVIFDLDGTLTRPYLDFDAIRAEIGIASGPILEAIDDMPCAAQARARDILDAHERAAAEHATLYPGAADTIRILHETGHPIAVLTRNARRWVDAVLDRFGITLDALRTREDGAIKPSAEPVRSICRQLHAEPARSWMVGDYLFDIVSGRRAGTHTVLMIGDRPVPDFATDADHVIRSLMDLPPIIDAAPPQAR
ncbi:MAG: HAD family hydrolase [Phycisphaerae bacterium]